MLNPSLIILDLLLEIPRGDHELELLLRSSLDFVFIYLLDFALIYQLMEAVATTQSTHKAPNDHPTPGAAAASEGDEEDISGLQLSPAFLD